MHTTVERPTVNLAAYPDLVVIYLGMRVGRTAGIETLLGFGPRISASASAQLAEQPVPGAPVRGAIQLVFIGMLLSAGWVK